MNYATSFPLAQPEDAHWTDTVVTQGHADYCRDNGHATYTVDGVTRSYCPRCGDTLPRTDSESVARTVTDSEFSPRAMVGRRRSILARDIRVADTRDEFVRVLSESLEESYTGYYRRYQGEDAELYYRRTPNAQPVTYGCDSFDDYPLN